MGRPGAAARFPSQPSVLFGLALAGFLGGIMLHQALHRHHMPNARHSRPRRGRCG
ncbi:MAG TPA: DUF2243 domain-containing protein [Acetobacteraceae bacterium]